MTTTVAVIYGGRSTEHSISCVSAGAVMAHLKGVEVVPVGIAKDGTWTVGEADPARLAIVDGQLPEVTVTREVTLSVSPETAGELRFTDGSLYAKADVIFPVLHGPFGEDGTIQGLFELSGIPYVGNGVLASAAAMDKEFTKKLMVAAGLPVTDEVILKGRTQLREDEKQRLGLPVFVKPARGGSSIGISKVTDWADLPAAIELALANDSKVIVEKEIVGAEVEVGVLALADGRLEASVPARLRGTEDSAEGFYGFETKYLDNVVTAEIPAQLDPDVTAELQEMATRAFRALECKGLARVDFFVTAAGPVLNEVNTMPGFTPISMFPQVFAASGWPYEELLAALIDGVRGHEVRDVYHR